MPIGRGFFRNNPYMRTPLSDNPYMASVMQGIDMVTQLAQEEQERSRVRDEENVEFERGQAREKSKRKFGMLSDIIGSRDATPETKASASDMFFKMIEDPDTDIADLDPEFKGDKTDQLDQPEPTYKISARAARFFKSYADKDLPFDVVRMLETQAVELEKAYMPKDKGGGGLMFNFGGRQLPAKPRIDKLTEYKKRAVAILRGGIQAEGGGGYKIGKNEAMMSQYIQTIEDLTAKLNENTWDDEAEEIYQALLSPEMHGAGRTEDFNSFRDMQHQFQQTMDEITGE